MTWYRDLSPVLAEGVHGIAFPVAGDAPGASVSYPEAGHEACLDIEDASFWFRHRNEAISAMVRRHPPDGLLLDVGGGNGYVAQRLVRDGWPVALLEPGVQGATNARLQRGLERVVCADFFQARISPGSVGAVGLFDVIEHVEDDRAMVEELARVLPPGGRVYMSVPAHAWLWSQADVDAGHFRRHTFDSMSKLLDGLFELEYWSYCFRPLLLPQLLLRALPFRMGLGRQTPPGRAEFEHGVDRGLAVRTLERLLRPELDAIAAGRRLSVGASAILVARRRRRG